jgi:hypothetical protein
VRNGCPSLKSMVGEIVIARIPFLERKEMLQVKIHGVEVNGIWIENQDFTNRMMKKFGMASSATTLILFVPFHGIKYIVGARRSLSLSETAFGLAEDG